MARKTHEPKTRYQVILEGPVRTSEANAKLKPIIKALLRRYDFVCVSAIQLKDPPPESEPDQRQQS
jgi:hypothetical protein